MEPAPNHAFLIRILTPLWLISQIVGCSQQAAPASSQATSAAASAQAAAQAATPAQSGATASKIDKPLQAQLMALIFGTKYRSASGDALATLPDINERQKMEEYVLTPESWHALPDGGIAMVANAQLPSADGPSHGQPGLLNVYLLRKNGEQWQVQKRFENLAELGSNGVFGEVEWLNLAPGKPGFLVHHGWTGQGQTISGFSVFALGQDQVQALTPQGINDHTDNDGDCLEDTDQCWNLDGKWRLDQARNNAPYQDIIIDYQGEQSTRAAPGSGNSAASTSVARNTVKVSGHARYGFDGKQYRLIEGKAMSEGPLN
ncbi:MAG: hypothetical protein RL748_2757 [Pseudomonadota bacterium]